MSWFSDFFGKLAKLVPQEKPKLRPMKTRDDLYGVVEDDEEPEILIEKIPRGKGDA